MNIYHPPPRYLLVMMSKKNVVPDCYVGRDFLPSQNSPFVVLVHPKARPPSSQTTPHYTEVNEQQALNYLNMYLFSATTYTLICLTLPRDIYLECLLGRPVDYILDKGSLPLIE